MENNWKEKIFQLNEDIVGEDKWLMDEMIECFMQFGNLVFEATKKECLTKVTILQNDYDVGNYKVDSGNLNEYKINKESILNINKPKL